jgi:2-polyprenyl-3-methyl-5-hydroxy-6-metoxy-1,4-benzoquinol methylase
MMDESDVGRALNREYYETLTAGRDDYWRKMAAPRHRVAEIAAILERASVRSLVDLGCGNGRLLEELSTRLAAPRLTGIDLSSGQIESNRKRHPEMEWHCLDLEESLPPSTDLAGQFDTVVASEIIEHVSTPQRFLRRAAELAEPGRGRLILTTQSGPVRETERRVGHLRHFSRDEVAELLARAGWVPVRVWNSGFPFHDLSKWYANLDPDASMARFGDRPYGLRESATALLLRVAFTFNSRRRGAQLFAVARRCATGQS